LGSYIVCLLYKCFLNSLWSWFLIHFISILSSSTVWYLDILDVLSHHSSSCYFIL
jgi:hypothetical protein